MSVIKYRLNAKTCKYSVLFEPLHDITLLVYNCRKFSPDNQYLMDECARFEQLIVQCLNTFLFKINCQSLSTYAELTDLCLDRTLQQVLDDDLGSSAEAEKNKARQQSTIEKL